LKKISKPRNASLLLVKIPELVLLEVAHMGGPDAAARDTARELILEPGWPNLVRSVGFTII
jgi:hypothetical protein